MSEQEPNFFQEETDFFNTPGYIVIPAISYDAAVLHVKRNPGPIAAAFREITPGVMRFYVIYADVSKLQREAK